jgi:hypothetical protein
LQFLKHISISRTKTAEIWQPYQAPDKSWLKTLGTKRPKIGDFGSDVLGDMPGASPTSSRRPFVKRSLQVGSWPLYSQYCILNTYWLWQTYVVNFASIFLERLLQVNPMLCSALKPINSPTGFVLQQAITYQHRWPCAACMERCVRRVLHASVGQFSPQSRTDSPRYFAVNNAELGRLTTTNVFDILGCSIQPNSNMLSHVNLFHTLSLYDQSLHKLRSWNSNPSWASS